VIINTWTIRQPEQALVAVFLQGDGLVLLPVLAQGSDRVERGTAMVDGESGVGAKIGTVQLLERIYDESLSYKEETKQTE